MTIQTALLQGTELLDAGEIIAPRLTAEVLLAHALRRDRSYLYAHSTDELSELGWIHYGRYLHERLKGKPTQYITGVQEFYGRDFRVNADVLIPRPETEHLVQAALGRITPDSTVVDVGTGSGAIAVTVALEGRMRCFATDISEAAVETARHNAQALGAEVNFAVGDLASCLGSRTVDVLVSNPPYVPRTDQPVLQREVRDFEPHVALFGGETGVEMYARLIRDAERVLRPGGSLLVELGYNSVEPVTAMLRSCWREPETLCDLAGLPRVLAVRYAP